MQLVHDFVEEAVVAAGSVNSHDDAGFRKSLVRLAFGVLARPYTELLMLAETGSASEGCRQKENKALAKLVEGQISSPLTREQRLDSR